MKFHSYSLKFSANVLQFLYTSDKKIRLNTLDADKQFFDAIQKLPIAEDPSINSKEIKDNFLNAYAFFIDKTKNLSEEDIIKIIKIIKNKIFIVHIKATDESTAIDTFQTINSMGMSLDEENLAKSILLIDCDETLKKNWENCFRSKNINNADFFHHYLALEYSNNVAFKGKSFKKSQILPHFLKELGKKTNKPAEVKKILQYAEIYEEILKQLDNNIKNEDNKEYFYCIKIFKEFNTRVFLPVLMKAIYSKENNVKQVADNIANIIMSYVLKGTYFSGFNKILPALLEDPLDNKSLEITTQDIEQNIINRYLDNKKAKAMLYLLELKHNENNQGSTVNLTFNKNLSLEHIYPQKPRKESTPLQNPDLYKYIGNMMLLFTGLNKKASNKDFTDKKIEYYEKDNLEPLKTAEYVLKQTEWLDEQIKENSNRLLKLMEQAWINKA